MTPNAATETGRKQGGEKKEGMRKGEKEDLVAYPSRMGRVAPHPCSFASHLQTKYKTSFSRAVKHRDEARPSVPLASDEAAVPPVAVSGEQSSLPPLHCCNFDESLNNKKKFLKDQRKNR
ncbi:hypothetical protein TcCL_ESM03712 [Trypanosoma cruzi]|nr:hypothetical protein TcCL_ESM03712 [Trypanosoma cruzi]